MFGNIAVAQLSKVFKNLAERCSYAPVSILTKNLNDLTF
jgi:hypothetical protein